MQLVSKVQASALELETLALETLASGTPILSHWKISIGCCYEGSLLLVLCQLISINKLESGKEQG
jgi:hypothetical protein